MYLFYRFYTKKKSIRRTLTIDQYEEMRDTRIVLGTVYMFGQLALSACCLFCMLLMHTAWIWNYPVAQQCCPGGNCPETPRRPSAGGLRTISAGTTLLGHTVYLSSNYRISNSRQENEAF